MAAFNPYHVDEIVTRAVTANSYFGLITNSIEAAQEELHGYEVTLSGKLVLPELCPRREAEKQSEAKVPGC